MLPRHRRRPYGWKAVPRTPSPSRSAYACLDAKGKKKGLFKVSEGDVSSVGLNIRQIVENALRCKAIAVVMAHNHPSGLALPSHEDEIATRLVREALDTVEIQLYDHIIVADNDYVSMAQSGLL